MKFNILILYFLFSLIFIETASATSEYSVTWEDITIRGTIYPDKDEYIYVDIKYDSVSKQLKRIKILVNQNEIIIPTDVFSDINDISINSLKIITSRGYFYEDNSYAYLEFLFGEPIDKSDPCYECSNESVFSNLRIFFNTEKITARHVNKIIKVDDFETNITKY